MKPRSGWQAPWLGALILGLFPAALAFLAYCNWQDRGPISHPKVRDVKFSVDGEDVVFDDRGKLFHYHVPSRNLREIESADGLLLGPPLPTGRKSAAGFSGSSTWDPFSAMGNWQVVEGRPRYRVSISDSVGPFGDPLPGQERRVIEVWPEEEADTLPELSKSLPWSAGVQLQAIHRDGRCASLRAVWDEDDGGPFLQRTPSWGELHFLDLKTSVAKQVQPQRMPKGFEQLWFLNRSERILVRTKEELSLWNRPEDLQGPPVAKRSSLFPDSTSWVQSADGNLIAETQRWDDQRNASVSLLDGTNLEELTTFKYREGEMPTIEAGVTADDRVRWMMADRSIWDATTDGTLARLGEAGLTLRSFFFRAAQIGTPLWLVVVFFWWRNQKRLAPAPRKSSGFRRLLTLASITLGGFLLVAFWCTQTTFFPVFPGQQRSGWDNYQPLLRNALIAPLGNVSAGAQAWLINYGDLLLPLGAAIATWVIVYGLLHLRVDRRGWWILLIQIAFGLALLAVCTLRHVWWIRTFDSVPS